MVTSILPVPCPTVPHISKYEAAKSTRPFNIYPIS
jgi:hypothetical protein